MQYLVIVAASEERLYQYLKARFEADTATRVILDRRRRGDSTADPEGRHAADRRRPHSAGISSFQRVAVFRLTAALRGDPLTDIESAGTGGVAPMEGIEGLEDRQRVDRWLEESQYLIGRIIPAYLDDRDRMRSRLEVVEQDNERLRAELGEARREITELRADLEQHRAERANVADSFTSIVEHLAALQKPINDVSRRLHTTVAPVPADA